MAYSIDQTTYDKATTYAPGHGYGHDTGPGYVAARPGDPTTVIVHTTNNRRPATSFANEATYLYESKDVSSHYLCGKTPAAGIVQFLDDDNEAWHSGKALPAYQNPHSIGIENHVSVGETFTAWQHEALTWLVQGLMARWGIPRTSIETHRAVALPKGRKSDPEGWGDAEFYAWRDTLVPIPFDEAPADYTQDSLLLGLPHGSMDQAIAYILSRRHDNYDDSSITKIIVPTYFEVCRDVGVDPILVLAQMIHETGNLTSFWSARGPKDQDENQKRNAAGIGVTGRTQTSEPADTTNWAYNPVRKLWEYGCGFRSWKDHSIPAHVGRILAYALPPNVGTPEQRGLIALSLTYRALPLTCQGSAPTLKQLGKAHNPKGSAGCGWAGANVGEGVAYGAAIATIANAIAGMAQ